ncbi:MAG: type II 3-dehydroquinate dehydratase [Clostridia bacterium]|nr:type II 3-dehydroquinate dehydratase [Clostridia bacterium]
MKILVINGPNLNMLGIREPDIYGRTTYADLCAYVEKSCKELGCECELYQSNHEGDIVDKIQGAYGVFDAIVINPGGYTHTSVAILDALKAVAIPTAEVHISDVDNREEFRKFSYVSLYAEKKIAGHGIKGYAEAVEYFVNKLK